MAITERKYAGEFILSESPGKISRDTVVVTVGATTTLQAGQVLGKITATGKYVPVANGATPASDGSQVAAAILYEQQVNATGSPVDVDAVVVNWSAEVRKDGLVWGSSDETDGLAELAANGVKGRD